MKAAVVGLGRLGCPLGLLFAEAGIEVMGVDTNPDLLDGLKRGVTASPEPHLASMLETWGPSIDWRSDVADAAECDVVFVVVPTPSLQSGAYDRSIVERVVADVSLAANHPVVVCVVSTTTPGDCEQIAVRMALAPHCQLVYAPEFVALGEVFAGMRRPDLILVGETDRSAGDRVLTCLRAIRPGQPHSAPSICRMGLTQAEVAKVALNSFLVTKISWANTLGDVCRGLGIDPHPVARAVGSDHRIGPHLLRPGGPAGGPCLPRDSQAFTHVAALAGCEAPISVAAGWVNNSVSRGWARRIVEDHNPGRVTILGTSYKPGTDVTTESFGLSLSTELQRFGVGVTTWDPIAECGDPDLFTAIQAADVVVVATSVRPAFIHPNVVDCWS